MRVAWIALLLAAGCGRHAFDLLSDASDGGTPDALTFPPFVCTAVRAPAPVVQTIDIAGTARLDRSGLVIAGAPSSGLADLTFTDATRQPTNRVELSIGAVRMGSIADTGQRLLLAETVAARERVLSTAYDGTDEQLVVSVADATMGRDCVFRAIDSARLLHAHAVGGNIDVRYVNADATLGPPFSKGVGAISELACHQAPDHVHMVWAETDGSCFATRVELGATMPTSASESTLADCTSPRGVLGNNVIDDGMIVSVDPAGQIQVQYAGGPDPEQVISPAGRAPKIGYDGARFWAAWIDTRTGEDRLRVGHVTMNGVVTDVELPILPAGDEAFELVYDGARLDLVVREIDTWNLLRLCP